jgi:hypothetical protein
MPEAGGEQGRYRVAEDVPERYYDIEQRRMALEAGLLGRLFGSSANAPIYIAGIVIFLFSIISIVVLFVDTKVPAADFLQIGIPLISLALGYLFGKST